MHDRVLHKNISPASWIRSNITDVSIKYTRRHTACRPKPPSFSFSHCWISTEARQVEANSSNQAALQEDPSTSLSLSLSVTSSHCCGVMELYFQTFGFTRCGFRECTIFRTLSQISTLFMNSDAEQHTVYVHAIFAFFERAPANLYLYFSYFPNKRCHLPNSFEQNTAAPQVRCDSF